EPVDGRSFQIAVAVVAGHRAVQVRVRGEGRHQVVRAPDERDSDAERVLHGTCLDGVEAARVVAGQVPDRAGRGVACGAPQLVVPLVVPGEELVVTGSVASHPGRNGLGGGILERLDAVAILTGECVQLGGAVLHVVDPVRFFVEVRRRAGRGLARTGIAAAELV